MADLEEDPDLRQNVNVYKDAKKIAVDTESEVADSDQEAFPQITLAEMLDDLVLEEMDSWYIRFVIFWINCTINSSYAYNLMFLMNMMHTDWCLRENL